MLTESMIKSFLTVAKTLNFTKAAQILYLTQQAVSRNISNLEKELAIPLIDRDTHSVRLTEYGALFYEQLQKIVQEYEALVLELKRNMEEQSHLLRLGIVDSPDFLCFQELAEEGKASFPEEIQLRILKGPPDDLQALLRTKELDAIITLDLLLEAGDDLNTLELKNTQMKLGVSRKNRRFEEGASWEHYAGEPLILHTEAGKHIYAENHFMNQLVKKIALSPSAVIIMTDVHKILSLVEEGRGIMLCTEMTPDLDESRIQLFDLPAGQASYVYAWLSDLPGPKAQQMEDFGRSLAAKLQMRI